MRALSHSDCLDIWERGSCLHSLDRALLALSAALARTPGDSLADWPLGRRNRALAELRCACFGPRLRGWLACSRCGEKLEFEMDGRALAGEEVEGGQDTSETIRVRGHSFRLPTSRDLARVARETDARSAAIRLMDGCRLEAGESPGWSDEDLEEVGGRMALADPLAEIRVTLHCPACGHGSDETLDIAAFLWTEIEGRAKRLLFEIHTLASAYGWTEREILSLSDSRRALYLEMAQS
jgi:hypothetical protein